MILKRMPNHRLATVLVACAGLIVIAWGWTRFGSAAYTVGSPAIAPEPPVEEVFPEPGSGFLAKLDSEFLEAHSTEDERGFIPKVYVDPQSVEHKYVVFVPFDMDVGEKRPVIVFLNGDGKNGSDGSSQLIDGIGDAIWQTKRSFPFVTIFPQCRDQRSWGAGGPEAEKALAILDRTHEEYGTDPDRVYLTGLSSGGSGTWSMGAGYPDRFAAIVPHCGGFMAGTAKRFADVNLPIWNFCVKGDARRLVEINRALQQALLDAGLSSFYTEVPGVDHNSWDFAFHTEALYDWLSEQSRAKNARPQPRFVRVLNDDSLGEWERRGDADWNFSAEGNLSCASDSPNSEAVLVGPNLESDFDLHLEFQLLEGSHCGIAFGVSPEASSRGSSDGFVVAATEPANGSGGVYSRATQGWIRPDNAIAQRGFRPKAWNDLRVSVMDGHLAARLNGWKLLDVQRSKFSPTGHVGLSGWGDNKGLKVAWRDVRIRVRDSSAASSRPRSTSVSEDGSVLPLDNPDAHDVFDDVTLGDIFDAWARRQERAETVRFNWKQDRSGLNRWSSYQQTWAPVGSNEAEPLSYVLRLDRTQLRHDCDRWFDRAGMEWGGFSELTVGDHPQSSLLKFAELRKRLSERDFAIAHLQRQDSRKFTSLYDSTTRRDFFSKADWQFPEEHVWDTSEYGEVDDLFFRPILLAYRPLENQFVGVRPERCRIVEPNSFVNGHTCVVLEEKRESGRTYRYWVDPRREFAVVRYIASGGEEPEMQLDVRYQEDAKHGWVAQGWMAILGSNRTSYPGRELVYQYASAKVTEFGINERLSPKTFSIDVPAGTVVADHRKRTFALVEPGGTRRALSSVELASLVNEASVFDALIATQPRRWGWGALAIGLMAAIVFGMRRRRSAAGSHVKFQERNE